MLQEKKKDEKKKPYQKNQIAMIYCFTITETISGSLMHIFLFFFINRLLFQLLIFV